MSFSEKTTNIINYPFTFDTVRILLLLITTVLVGYTLQPIPKWLDKLFNTSIFFKFIILFIIGLISVYPITPFNLIIVFMFSIVVLVLFSISRYVDVYIEKNNEKKIEKLKLS